MWGFLNRIFGSRPERILLKQELVDSVIELAKRNYPNEFVALIHGTIGGDIVCDYLLYQTFHASRHSATMQQSYDFPMLSGAIGSVHSHPGSNRPSSEDLRFFNKSGIIHIIIGHPYSESNISVYDKNGNELRFEIDNNI